MTEIGLGHYLTLGAIIFSIGIIGIFLNRKNIIVILMSIELIIVIGGWKYKPDLFDLNNSMANFSLSNTHSIGQILYTDYIHVFQISGMILLVAMVGAIVLTFRKREGVKTQSYLKQISRERSEGVQIIEVETNKGVKIDD